jgi:hypothetical protein
VARAKRTARADARRRYRAEQNLVDESAAIDGDAAPTATAAAKPGATSAAARPRTAAPAPANTPPRMSIGTAFRMSFRPLDVRGDLAALPALALRTKALWIPILLVIASTALIFITAGLTGDETATDAVSTIGRWATFISQFMFAYFIQTPAIGAVFLAGFLAPRASWLLGAIVGLVAAICYGLIILIYPTAIATDVPTASQANDVILAALVLTPLMGAFFASAAAWYRRFLQLSNPNRGQRRQQAKPKANDGRTRSSGSQKAGARR